MLAAITKQHLGRLEQQGVVRRAGRDEWLLVATMNALLVAARQRSAEYSEAKATLEKIKVARERMRALREAGQLAPASDIDGLVEGLAHVLLPILAALPVQIGEYDRQDRALRKFAERCVYKAQEQIANGCRVAADRLKGNTDNDVGIPL